MAIRDNEYEAAVAGCEAAITAFKAASAMIDKHLLEASTPNTAEFLIEEIARTKLVDARRRLSALPRYSRPAERSVHEAHDESRRT
jgi:hypothetical protein